jgi:hypothetical protein
MSEDEEGARRGRREEESEGGKKKMEGSRVASPKDEKRKRNEPKKRKKGDIEQYEGNGHEKERVGSGESGGEKESPLPSHFTNISLHRNDVLDDDLEYDESYDSDELKATSLGDDEEFFHRRGKRDSSCSQRTTPSPKKSPASKTTAKSSPRQSPSATLFSFPTLEFHLELSPRESVTARAAVNINGVVRKDESLGSTPKGPTIGKKLSTPNLVGKEGPKKKKKSSREKTKSKNPTESTRRSPSSDFPGNGLLAEKEHQLPPHIVTVHPSDSPSLSSSLTENRVRRKLSGGTPDSFTLEKKWPIVESVGASCGLVECPSRSAMVLDSDCSDTSTPPTSPSSNSENSIALLPLDAMESLSPPLSLADSSGGIFKSPVKRLPIPRLPVVNSDDIAAKENSLRYEEKKRKSF